MELDLETTTIGKYTAVRVFGELDIYTLPEMISLLRLLILQGERYIAIDLSSCLYCDSESFKVFASIANALGHTGNIAVCGGSETVLKAMKALRLDTFMTLLPSIEYLEPSIYELDMVSDLPSSYITECNLEVTDELSSEN